MGPSLLWYLLVPLLAFLGTPLFAILALIALLAFAGQGISSSAVITEMLRLAGSPVLVAIPLFTLAGYVFAEAGTPLRLIRLMRALFGWIPGGVAIVTMIACAVFTAFTGASGVTIIALGGLLMPALLKAGFPEKFALGLLTTGGSLGIVFPPSLALILYSYVAMQTAGGSIQDPLSGPTVDRLFLAGIVPGILMIALLALLAFRRGGRGPARSAPAARPAGEATDPAGTAAAGPEGGAGGRFSIRELARAARGAVWEIPLPFLLLGGIYGGFLTIMEAAAVTAFYALVVEVFLYRDIPLRKLPSVAADSMMLVGGILIILASAMGMTNYLIDVQVPMKILDGIEGLITSRFAFLLALNILLLIVGCLMDIFSALVVVVPLIIPVAQRYGVDLTHLGIIFLANLEIGYMTPPVGLNLFISSFRFRKPILAVYSAAGPFLLVLLAALLLITYVPGLSLWLVQLFG